MSFFHGSNSDLEIGKVISWKGSKSPRTFGDYEKILEATRPKSMNSRLSSFYVTDKKSTAKTFADSVYLVEIPKKVQSQPHYLGWITVLTNMIDPSGFKKNYGYTVDNWRTSLANEDIKIITDAYWSGVRPSKRDLSAFNTVVDGETYLVEYLSDKIKVLKRV